ncbi:TPA: DHH family phosphoesterase [Candidatus Woesearchaeota archaeon]|nr:DHH family phosphoesterase [Candidatus Woesearchaeota archaeon]
MKSHPKVDSRFFNVVKEYDPDKIFILDLAILDEAFAEEFSNIPIVWIDHHSPIKIPGVKYFNPRIENPSDITCVSHLCYDVVKEHTPEDLWIAAAGIIGDWQLTKTTEEFSEKYPDLLPASINRPEEALFGSPFSKLIKMMSFILKGRTQDVMKCVKIITRINSPYELLNGETPRSKFIVNRFEKINELYESLLSFAMKKVSKSKLLVVSYTEEKMSFSGELSNELLYRYPDKVILVGREKSGEMKCSIRTGPGINLPKTLETALNGIDGYGGGHEHACGSCVKVADFKRFIKQLKEAIK